MGRDPGRFLMIGRSARRLPSPYWHAARCRSKQPLPARSTPTGSISQSEIRHDLGTMSTCSKASCLEVLAGNHRVVAKTGIHGRRPVRADCTTIKAANRDRQPADQNI